MKKYCLCFCFAFSFVFADDVPMKASAAPETTKFCEGESGLPPSGIYIGGFFGTQNEGYDISMENWTDPHVSTDGVSHHHTFKHKDTVKKGTFGFSVSYRWYKPSCFVAVQLDCPINKSELRRSISPDELSDSNLFRNRAKLDVDHGYNTSLSVKIGKSLLLPGNHVITPYVNLNFA